MTLLMHMLIDSKDVFSLHKFDVGKNPTKIPRYVEAKCGDETSASE